MVALMVGCGLVVAGVSVYCCLVASRLSGRRMEIIVTDFSALSAQVDRSVSLGQQAVTIIQNSDGTAEATALEQKLQAVNDGVQSAITAASPAPAPQPADQTSEQSAPVDDPPQS
jgi:hypothetical protein